MIAKLSGRLDDSGADWAVIEVGGVGYLVHCSARTLASLGARGEAATLFTQMQVSDNDLRLIGFATAGEREWFRLLGAIQGVGSKVALAILSVLSIEELQRACANGDVAMVARAQGVGGKLASRIVNELKDKAGALPTVSGGAAPPPSPGTAAGDAVSALQNLGFKPAVASAAVARAQADLGEEAALDDLVRVALRRATA
jgi:Holliday junction DNA helicase RuvA